MNFDSELTFSEDFIEILLVIREIDTFEPLSANL